MCIDDFGPSVVRRYNLVSGRADQRFGCAPAPVPDKRLNLMEQMADSRMPPGFGYDWTGMSFQEKLAGSGQATVFLTSRCRRVSCSWPRSMKVGPAPPP